MMTFLCSECMQAHEGTPPVKRALFPGGPSVYVCKDCATEGEKHVGEEKPK